MGELCVNRLAHGPHSWQSAGWGTKHCPGVNPTLRTEPPAPPPVPVRQPTAPTAAQQIRIGALAAAAKLLNVGADVDELLAAAYRFERYIETGDQG